MNLAKLFEMQRELDDHIEQEHPREPGEDRLAKKILALLVELGELANEWRGFKFWSSRQEPVPSRRSVHAEKRRQSPPSSKRLLRKRDCMTIKFTVWGEPVAQGRPRATTVNGHVRMYDPKKSRDYKYYVRMVASQHRPKELLTGPLKMKVIPRKEKA